MTITVVFTIALVLIVAVFDFWVIYKKGKYFSISAYIIRWSKKYPSIPFLIGFLCGHLFWSMDTIEWKYEDPKKVECKISK